jgi:hypothetical protein
MTYGEEVEQFLDRRLDSDIIWKETVSAVLCGILDTLDKDAASLIVDRATVGLGGGNRHDQ